VLERLFPAATAFVRQLDAGKIIALPAVVYLMLGAAAGVLNEILDALKSI
jgi:hypothetical protein